jgi:hypothetical protein
VLIFLADLQKWIDLFAYANAAAVTDVEHRSVPGPGDLLLACSDAIIAAQTAALAAESLGIGSCYIGDILENAEVHCELLGLPQHTLPVAMLVFGRPRAEREPAPRQTKYVVMRDRYHRLTDDELSEVTEDLGVLHAPHGFRPGIENYPQAIYARKFTSDFMREMNRSVAWWLERWQSAE